MRNITEIIWNNDDGFEFNSQTFENDFVVLKLENPLELNENVQPACLPPTTDFLDVNSTEDQCFTSGWGTLESGKYLL